MIRILLIINIKLRFYLIKVLKDNILSFIKENKSDSNWNNPLKAFYFQSFTFLYFYILSLKN